MDFSNYRRWQGTNAADLAFADVTGGCRKEQRCVATGSHYFLLKHTTN